MHMLSISIGRFGNIIANDSMGVGLLFYFGSLNLKKKNL